MCVEEEVVDASLDYNLLLGRSWTYAMQVVVATVLWVLLFPHEDQIVTIDQLSFSRPDPSLGVSMVLMIDNPQPGGHCRGWFVPIFDGYHRLPTPSR